MHCWPQLWQRVCDLQPRDCSEAATEQTPVYSELCCHTEQVEQRCAAQLWQRICDVQPDQYSAACIVAACSCQMSTFTTHGWLMRPCSKSVSQIWPAAAVQ